MDCTLLADNLIAIKSSDRVNLKGSLAIIPTYTLVLETPVCKVHLQRNTLTEILTEHKKTKAN